MESIDYSGPRVRQCEDGKYRWRYEMNMLTNPTIFLTVFKIFFYIILVGFVIFGTFLYAIHGDWEGLWGMAKAMLIVMGVFAVLTFLGVLVLAIMYRGKYVVLFEMDEKEIAHIQEPRQFRKAQKIGAATTMAGFAAGNYTAAGAGILSTTKSSSTSILANVRRVKPRRWLHVIKVNQLLNKNQIYVPAEDFDFVYNFLKEHCPNAK